MLDPWEKNQILAQDSFVVRKDEWIPKKKKIVKSLMFPQ